MGDVDVMQTCIKSDSLCAMKGDGDLLMIITGSMKRF